MGEESDVDVTAAAPMQREGEALHCLGEVVWAREKGWPSWPALVIPFETTFGLANLSEPKQPLTLTNVAAVI